ncbi:MAG: hypothetical protein ACLP19_01885 [Xanthobacteraceae bacterium]
MDDEGADDEGADDEGIGEEGMGDAMTSPSSVELAVGGSSFII